VHFHGNGESVADYVPAMANQFLSLGLNVLFAEYRGYGESTGNAELATMLDDGESVLEQSGIKPEKAIVFGRSIGSLYAIELAYRLPTLAGLIIESGIADPYERFMRYADFNSLGYSPEEVKADSLRLFNHEEKLGAYRNPLLILHTEFDQIINITHAERNLAWSASSEKRLVRFHYGDHNSIFPLNKSKYLESLKQFCDFTKKNGPFTSSSKSAS